MKLLGNTLIDKEVLKHGFENRERNSRKEHIIYIRTREKEKGHHRKYLPGNEEKYPQLFFPSSIVNK